jgi:hypothetical protein
MLLHWISEDSGKKLSAFFPKRRRNVYRVWGSGKSGDPILFRELPHIKSVVMRRAILKITKGLDLTYELKG